MVGYIQSPHAHSANPPAPWSETTTGRRSVAPRGKATRPIPSSPMGSIHTPPSAASLGGATTTAKLPGVEGMGLGGSHPRQRARATQTVASELGRMVGLSRDPARCDEQPRGSWRHDDGARSKTNEQSQWLLLRPLGMPMESSKKSRAYSGAVQPEICQISREQMEICQSPKSPSHVASVSGTDWRADPSEIRAACSRIWGARPARSHPAKRTGAPCIGRI